MRVLAVHPGPSFSVADVHLGWVNALRGLGCTVAEYNLDDRLTFYGAASVQGQALTYDEVITLASKGLEGKCYEFEPDVILVTSAFFIDDFTWQLWRRKPSKVVLLCTESPYEDDRQCALIERVEPDLVLINDPTNLDAYRNIHKRSFYIPHSFDPALHKPAREKRDADFTFVGTGYPSRIEFFNEVDWTGISVRLAGNWKGLDGELSKSLVHDVEDCCENADAVKLYHRTKASANLYRAARRADIEANRPELARGWSMGPRELELSACETFFLREPRGEGDAVLSMLPTFTEPGEFAEKLRWFLAHDRARRKAAAAARAAVQDRTFDAHARRMLRLLP